MGWYEALANALQKETSAVMQFATIEPPNTPRVRSIIHRGFLTASTLPTLPLIIATTDIRTAKITQLNAHRTVEIVYWTPSTQEQYRILGRTSIVPSPEWNGNYPAIPDKGAVYEALTKERFDWEGKRVSMFNAMSGHMRATWCRPVPGTPLGDDSEWPVTVSRMEEEKGEEEQRLLRVALGHFALVVVEPVEVDYVELGVVPNRRRRFEREEGSAEFRETFVIP